MRYALAIMLTLAPLSGSAQVTAIAHVCTWLDTGNDSWKQASTIPWRSEGLGIGYSAINPKMMLQQATEMRQYGITPLLSWWGPDVPRGGDNYLDAWSSTVNDLPAVILYEGQGRLRQDDDGWWTIDARDNARTLREDLTHLYRKYWTSRPSQWYRRNNKFVVYLWPLHAMRGDLKAVLDELPFRDALYVVGTEFDGLRLPSDVRAPMISGVDAITGYGFYNRPLMARTGGVLSDELIAEYRFASLSWQEYLAAHHPGVELILPLQFSFDDRNVPGRVNPVYEASPEQAQKLIAEMRQIIGHFHVTCGNVPAMITLASYNEHFEGSAIEPNDRYGDSWLVMVARGISLARLPASACTK
jgi:hypothetical protein